MQEWTQSAAYPSVSVGVFYQGEVIWQEAFGWKNQQQQVKATVNTIYPLASVTKTFTATAIMMLVEEGRINLDKPVSAYFGHEVVNAHFDPARPVTVRDLLRHTSGLDMHYRNVYHDEIRDNASKQSASSRFNTLIFDPAERFTYSNVGYTILGELIEEVSGLTFETFLHERLFSPLGMNQTTVRIDPELIDDYAQLRGAKGETLPLVYTDTKGAGDIYCSVKDLLVYGQFHLGGEDTDILKAETLSSMKTVIDTSVKRPDPCQPYGLGWFFTKEGAETRSFWHEGGFDGAGSMLKVFPKDELVVAVIGNTTFNKARSGEITDAIVDVLLPGYTPISCPTAPLSPGVDTLAFKGKWSGAIYAEQDTIPLSIRFEEDGDIIAGFTDAQTRFFFIDDQAFPKEAFVHYPNSSGNHLTGWLLEGIITTKDWRDNHHIIQLDLYRRGEEIVGAAKAFETNQDREGLATAFYLKLNRLD